mgnify:CR=1 FL=1
MQHGMPSRHGTTSACAENTLPLQQEPKGYGNYLRMRGEYEWFLALFVAVLELPPHARRIRPVGR